MKGQILDYSAESGTGVICTNDGTRYQFSSSDWKGRSFPTRGMHVDFEGVNNQAKEIYPALGTAAPG